MTADLLEDEHGDLEVLPTPMLIMVIVDKAPIGGSSAVAHGDLEVKVHVAWAHSSAIVRAPNSEHELWRIETYWLALLISLRSSRYSVTNRKISFYIYQMQLI